MKKHIKILSLSVVIGMLMIASCEKAPVATDTQVGISKVTYYANITVKGDQYVSIVKGGSFTDPGAEATAKGKSLEVKTSGSVDVNTPGLYILTYTAVNADGYAASKSRTVAVLPSAEQAGVDISGNYIYVGTTYASTITKLAPGFYSANNVWGSTNIPAMFICVDGENIDIPQQSGGFGPIFGSGTITSSGALTYSVNLPAYGYSNIIRKWQKQ